jgi:hypothetical protein
MSTTATTLSSRAFKPLSATRFKRLSAAQRRVAIARDIIARIDASLLMAGEGTLGMDTRMLLTNAEDSADVRRRINRTQCEGCAKGAVFLSWVGTLDSVPPERCDVYADLIEEFPKDLVGTFGPRLLHAIEIAYEGWTDGTHGIGHQTSKALVAALYTPNDVRWSATTRLKGIMENLIANKGKLVVPDGKGGKLTF